MSVILIAILAFIGALLAISVVLSRMTYEVESARDTEYLELEGNWIRYHVAGGGPPVVLVHGWLSSSKVWEGLASRLAQRFTVYTIDLSGFGESDKPISGYGIRYGSRLLYAFCAHCGLTRATVVGHDIGGAMAVKLAADHPDVVGRLVLVATPADENQIDLPTFLWLATLPVIGAVFYTLGRFSRFLRRLWMRPFVFHSEALTEEVVHDAGRSTPAAVNKTLSVVRREISRGRLLRQVGIIKVPVLVIAGEADKIVDPRAAEAWAENLSVELVLLDECGHLPMLERTAEFNAQVLAFLTGDQRYLDTRTTPEEMGREDTAAETLQEPGSLTHTEAPESPIMGSRDSPAVRRRREDGSFPARNPRDPENVDVSQEVSEPPSGADPAPDSDSIEEHPRGRTGSEGGAGDRSVPEVPKDLFELPDSLKEFPTRDRSPEADRQVRKERSGEDANSRDPENDAGS